MKVKFLKTLPISLIIFFYSIYVNAKDPLELSLSVNFYKDLSDSYGKGNLLFGDFDLSKSWYGIDLGFGHFQGQSTFIFQAFFDETNQSLEIPFEELTIMKMAALSGLITPINNNWIEVNLLFGGVLSKANSLMFQSVDFEYNINENKFIYLYKDFQSIESNHYGYQVGLNVSFYTLKRIELQLKARIQDLSNGGTFFLIGGGLCFNISKAI